MSLESIAKKIEKHPLTNELLDRSNRSERLILTGASRTAKALITTSLAKKVSNKLLIIVPTLEEATRWFPLIKDCGWSKTCLYPTSEVSPYDSVKITSEIIWGQLQVLSDILELNDDDDIAIIATERSLQPHLPPIEYLKSKCIKLKVGDEINLESLSLKLSECGYQKTNNIDQEGTWTRRGDILDIYPVSSELPIRLELFGDQLEKIKEFDPLSQRSLDKIDNVCITPTGFDPIILDRLLSIKNKDINNIFSEQEYDEITNSKTLSSAKKYLGLAFENPSSLLNYLDTNTFIVVEERNQSISHSNAWNKIVSESFEESLKLHKTKEFKNIRYEPNLHKDTKTLFDKLNLYKGLDTSDFENYSSQNNIFNLSSKTHNWLPNQYGKISSNVREYINQKYSVWIISAQPTRAKSLLDEHDCIAKFIPDSDDLNGIKSIIDDNLPVAIKNKNDGEIEGFLLQPWKIALITDKEFFGQINITTTGYVRRRKQAISKKIDPNKMKPGDYVVHRNHGIGLFQKIEKLNINGESRDYLVIKYSDGKLSVAADQLGSLGRYRNSNSKIPIINKLGGKNWNRIKDKAKKSVKKVAIDLIKLYAQRSKEKGYKFPHDGPWQIELENSFPYDLTPDQAKATKQVKSDMESDKPMDRLVCGDVGFGKTEVAIRAIFKAITSGKQIAFLAPTTVLSQQHWRTISDRFAPYPIKVSLLNRFKTNSERKDILSGLKEGIIDAVIGTHQLLNKNLSYKDLGLLVIDEEQRFGVNQKEKIKELKKSVDVLTLSATPIPRTLYMSLSGVREMSLITTPPPLRRPIKTHLAPLDNEIIRSAISQEIDRGGQIFYIVPRIKGIEDVAEKLNMMIPNVKLLIAHGQMEEGVLENAMLAFNAGEADILLCTTIVESGLDIPRVNTILIEDSHKFGLSQLYQLRGRVGRSGVQAHAWLFYPNNEKLNDASRQRLKAIQEFTDLGSGYQLAMRDMEIRGVGNILGIEQSGQMETIGFDLYMELLQETIAEIQGQDIPSVEDTQIDLPVTAFIPGDWITDPDEKINAYRLATQCESNDALVQFASNLVDRYGTLPKAVESLIEVMKLKIIAKKCGFSRIKLSKPNIELETIMDEPAFKLLRKGLPSHLHGRFIYKKGDMYSTVIIRGLGILDSDKLLDQLIEWLSTMNSEINNQ
ncbi:transcription-repair coupling factor [Prochlorococcus marinus]|uniref:Transcription-repair-coupling factor n=1 Tax=Prochlorococcus marinus XMU1408 TaxID=2213228 RepID=A0A318R4P6_PROMR|nr:transcription-repair coupling factor [Prochlorococcus marinus]MBW3042001.1 transcription-repair coupling factor [Prochlorococcus marinus str. XMU1408]PYE03124.1 transcription-repair coupling factor [Prochlorococcus marinus XMU1408]